MALPEGTRLGPYEIAGPLGAGGMGEVYRARDTRLDRTVALKVLSPTLAASPELEARFEREARAIAALQHPHICVLHDLGREGTAAYLVMEFLEGEALSARLRRGPLPLAEIVRIGAQIAEALDAAHRAGIVHRDLKPGNIMLTRDGAQTKAKLLDFGLAKPAAAAARPASSAPTFTATLAATELASPVTQAGAVIGTVQYMSPEQIEGREVDARSDIFALGCVLYEMAAGKPAFEGKSSLSVASAILEKDPPPVVPPALDRVIRLCLAKAPEERLQSARDAALLLREVKPGTPAARAEAERPRRWWPIAFVGAAVGALALAGASWLLPRAPGGRVIAELPAPAGVVFDFGGSAPGPPVMSPDGSAVVFAAHSPGQRRQLWLRRLDETAAQPLPGTDDALLPFWSPDGRSVGFFTFNNSSGRNAGRIMIYNLESGQIRVVAQTTVARGATWAADGTIVFAPDVTGGLKRVAAAGGPSTPLPIPRAAEYTSLRYPYFLPDGKHILYLAVSHADSSHDQIFFASLDGKVNRPLVHATTGGIFAAANGMGYLLYSSHGTLMAQRISPSSGALAGAAQPVAHGVFEDVTTWRPAYSASQSGELAFASGALGAEQLAWVNRKGAVIGTLPPFPGAATTAALSPGGRRLALSVDYSIHDIWVVRLSDGARARFTFGPVGNLFPVWSPDGQWIAYGSDVAGAMHILRRRANGNGEALAMAQPSSAPAAYPSAWTPDGSQLLVVGYDAAQNGSALGIYAVPLSGNDPRTVVPPGDNVFGLAQLSPDGRWVSYAQETSGQLPNLFIVPFAGGGGKWQVTTQGVQSYFWADGGKELDVIDGNGTLQAIPVSVQAGAPTFGAPQTLGGHFPTVLAATADGRRFLAVTYPDDHQRIVYVRNWAAALH